MSAGLANWFIKIFGVEDMSIGLLQPKAKVTSAPAKLFISLRNGFLPRESSCGCTLSDFAKSNGQSLVLQSPLVKPKLTVGQQSDAYEQEADWMADQVMSMPEPKVQRACPKCGEDEAVRAAPIAAQIMPLAQRQAVPEEENDVAVQAISNSLTLQRQEEEPEEEQLQTKQSNITHLVQRQWSDAPKAPSGGAQSRFVIPPSSGWNASEVRVGKIRRIPIEGLTKGYQYLNPSSAAVESANERAIVLIPEVINLQQPVEVLLHLHGHEIGYRQRKQQGPHPALKPGTVRDVDVDRIEQQLEASGRPMIGVLAQGTTSSDFASDFDSDAYLSDVFRVLGNMSIWGQNQAPQIRTVVLSGHSGAAKPITKMMAEPGQPHMPSKLGEVILFDAIHSSQLPTIQTWILRRLDQDLSALTASGLTNDQQIIYLRTSLRFRGYYTNTEYAKRYLLLRKAIESWFARNAAKLGGTSSSVFRDLKDNYQVIAVGHSDHEEIMGRDNRLKDALSALPAISSPTLGSNASSSNPSSPSSIPPVAPGAGVAEPLRDAGAEDISGAPTTLQRIAIGNQAIKSMLQAKPLSNQLSLIHRKSPTSALDVILNSQEGAGHPLDNASLKFFGQRMGHDFSGVRVHSDSQSNRAARVLNAQAFTTGQDIYFGEGQYLAGIDHRQRLLAHELAHVVQQRKSPEPSLQRAAILYETTGFEISPPSKPFTLQDAKQKVDKKKGTTPPDLAGASIRGAAPGSNEEIFLWHSIAQVVDRKRWGSEMDLIVPIGWPLKVGDPAPVGRVTVSIDASGNAVAELISAGTAPVPTTFSTVADAEKKLKTDFGISGFKDDDASWTVEEANKVAGAFALLPAGDRAALRGVVLLRVVQIDGGETAGEFSSDASVSGAIVTSETKLKLANKAFAGESTRFVGGVSGTYSASYMTIAHEVGHAIATQTKREATLTHLQAVSKANVLVEKLNLAVEARNQATDEYNILVGEYNMLVGEHNAAVKSKDAARIALAKKEVKAKKKEVDAKGKQVEELKLDEDTKRTSLSTAKKEAESKEKLAAATRISAVSLNPFKTTAATEKTKATNELKRAQAAVKAYKPQDASDSESYRKAVESVETAINEYATSTLPPDVELEPLEKIVQVAIDNCSVDRENLRASSATNPALTDFSAGEMAQKAWYEAEKDYAWARQRTARVQRFVDFVNSKKIEPFTTYAKEKWPHEPEEFFAEAYSLWRTDPAYLKANARALFDWFDAGKYR